MLLLISLVIIVELYIDFLKPEKQNIAGEKMVSQVVKGSVSTRCTASLTSLPMFLSLLSVLLSAQVETLSKCHVNIGE